MRSDRFLRADRRVQQASATIRRIDVGGVVLSLSERGPVDAPAVIVLHGFTGSAQAMEPLAKRLATGLEARVVCLDLVGHGHSEVPDDFSLYRVGAMAGQVAAVAGALGCDPFHLVGYSMGGRVALALGCTEPRKLRSLSVIGASAGIADPTERRRRGQVDAARAERILTDLEAFVDEWMADPLFAGQASLGDCHLRDARVQRLASQPEGLARSLLAGGTGSMTPLHSRLEDCDAPTLVLAGAQDSKFCSVAEQLAAALPRATVALIDGAGHAAHLEQPDATAAAIAEFIAETGALPAGAPAPMPTTVTQPEPTAGAEGRRATERQAG